MSQIILNFSYPTHKKIYFWKWWNNHNLRMHFDFDSIEKSSCSHIEKSIKKMYFNSYLKGLERHVDVLLQDALVSNELLLPVDQLLLQLLQSLFLLRLWRRRRRTWTHAKNTQVRETDAHCFSTIWVRASKRLGKSERTRCLRVRRAPTRAALEKGTKSWSSAFFFHQENLLGCACLGDPHTAFPIPAAAAASSAGRVFVTYERGLLGEFLFSRVGTALELCNESSNTHYRRARARRRLISLFWSKGGQGGGKLNDECQPAALECNESVHGCGFLDQFLFRDELLAFIISVAWYLKFKI